MPKYHNGNLVKYDETIRLFIADDGVNARLELCNYEEVLSAAGAVAGKLPLKQTLVVDDRQARCSQAPLDIGSMLRPLDVIKFQRAVFQFTRSWPPNTQPPLALALESGMKALAIDVEVKATPGAPADTRRKTGEAIKAALASRLRPDRDQDAVRASFGFVPYFPRPGLIPQEERTVLQQTRNGKTANRDNRRLRPVASAGQRPVASAVEELMAEIDRETIKRHGSLPADELMRKLHAAITKVRCFAFRADTRDPTAVHAAKGLLPSFTRKDEDFKTQPFVGGSGKTTTVGATAAVFDTAENLARYVEQFKVENIVHLGSYTENERFRGYVSTTKSIAIVKCFANYFTQKPVGTAWCYAARCRAGYELPSHVEPDAAGNIKADKHHLQQTLHEFVNYLEQEVAVPGAIWWDDVVGFRRVDYDADGQFLTGPVFLRESQYWQVKGEGAAFDELFDLLSGKSQGLDPTTHATYRRRTGALDPWDLVPDTR